MTADQKKYTLRSFISIRHSFDGNIKHEHAHTVEISCTVKTATEDMIDYFAVEKTIKSVFDRYEGKYLNDITEFCTDATIEHLGEVLCRDIDNTLLPMGYAMDRFEIGETPLRVYVITDELRN